MMKFFTTSKNKGVGYIKLFSILVLIGILTSSSLLGTFLTSISTNGGINSSLFHPQLETASSGPIIKLETPSSDGGILTDKDEIKVRVSSNSTYDLDTINYTWDTSYYWEEYDSPSNNQTINVKFYFDADGVDHTLTVFANNTNSDSTTKTYTFKFDTIDPQISLDSFGGTDDETFNPENVNSINFTIFDNNFDYTGYRWDSESYSYISSTDLSVPTSDLSEGSHYLYIQAIDEGGNNHTTQYYFTADSKNPTIYCNISEGSTVATGSTIPFTIDVTSPTYQNPRYTRYKWDSSDLSANYTEKNDDTFTVYVPPTLANRDHLLYMETCDQAGNTHSESFSYTVDGSVPTITLNTPSENQVVSQGSKIDLWIDDDSEVDTAWYEWENDDHDTVKESTFASPYDVTVPNMKDGNISLQVYANDTVGHKEHKTFQFNIDTTNPTIKLIYPANEHMLVNNTTDIILEIADANLKNITYYWDDNSEKIKPKSEDDVAKYFFSTRQFKGFNSHSLTVYAYDIREEWDDRTFSFIIDGIPPQINVSLSDGDILTGTEEIHIIAADKGNVTEIALRLNGEATKYRLTSNTRKISWFIDFDSTEFSDSDDHNIQIYAWDIAENYQRKQFSVTIDNSPPESWVIQQPEVGSVINPKYGNLTTIWQANQKPASGYAYWTLYFDGEMVTTIKVIDDTTSQWTYNITTNLGEGQHKISLVATSGAGLNYTKTRNVFIDTTAPLLSFQNTLGIKYTNQNISTIIWEVNDETSVKCKLQKWDPEISDWRNVSSWTSKTKMDVLLETSGNHTFMVLGKDDAGNNATTTNPTTLSIIKDITKPESQLTVDASSPISKRTVLTVTIFAKDTTLSKKLESGLTSSPNVSIYLQGQNLKSIAYLIEENSPNNRYRYNKTFEIDLSMVSLKSKYSRLIVRLNDVAGNPIYMYNSFNVDVDPPDTWLKEQAIENHSVIASSTVKIGWNGTDKESSISYYLLHINNRIRNRTKAELLYFTLKEGNYTLYVEAFDKAGNIGKTAKLYFIVDRTAPSITLLSNKSFWKSSTLEIQWKGNDKVGIQLYRIYDGTEFIKSTTAQQTTIPVNEGFHSITVEAIDYYGRTANTTWETIVDYTAPRIRLQSHSGQKIYHDSNYISLNWTLHDQNLSNSTLTSILLDGKLINKTHNSSISLNLKEGTYSLQLQTKDKAGNIGSKNLQLNIDLTPPKLDLWVKNEKRNGYIVENVTELAWQGEDASPLNYTGYVDGKKRFETIQIYWSLNLSEGHHIIRVVASDPTGHTADQVVSVTIDTGTMVKIISPRHPIMQGSSKRVKLSWRTNESVSGLFQYKLYIDGKLVAIPTNNSISWNFNQGITHFSVKIWDQAKNMAQDNITIILDGEPPEILNAELHQDDNVVAGENTTFSWTVKDNPSGYDHAKIIVDGNLKRITSKSFVQFQLSNGDHKIELFVYDKAGNYVVEKSNVNAVGGPLLGVDHTVFITIVIGMLAFYVILGLFILKKE